MKLSKKVQDALNQQINLELASAYVYLAMSADFLNKGFKGFAQWMQMQAQEEVGHAMRLFHYVDERGGRIVLQGVKGPQETWETPLTAFENSLAHEQHVTKSIHDIVSLALEEKDYGTVRFLDWFVNEQVEEESTVGDAIARLEMVKDDKAALYFLDRELGARQDEGKDE